MEQSFRGGGVLHRNQHMILHAVVVKIPRHILEVAEVQLPTILAAHELLTFVGILKIGIKYLQASQNGPSLGMIPLQMATFCALWHVGGRRQNGAVTKL